MFDPGPAALPVPRVQRAPSDRLWTENKALLIERYLYYFVLVTKHGTYIDGFAGPQYPDKPEAWAAFLVLETEPPWLRHFHLFEKSAPAADALDELAGQHRDRDVHVYRGDFNQRVDDILVPAVIRGTEATFCLVDQRTFECEWETLRRLAAYKGPLRIELFYFFPNGWLGRALGNIRSEAGWARVRAWWGRDDAQVLRDMRGPHRAEFVARRFLDELGYLSAQPYAIYDREEGGRVMYWMIHATDHPAAPKLMDRAYTTAVRPPEVLIDQSIIGEIGVDMARFGSSARLASWAGMCSGNNESAGKHRSGKTRKGSKWLRTALTESATAAARSKGTYFSAQHARLRGRRGPKRATIAVGHSILVATYHMLDRNEPFTDLGADFFVGHHDPNATPPSWSVSSGPSVSRSTSNPWRPRNAQGHFHHRRRAWATMRR